jgi:hypothetical protein
VVGLKEPRLIIRFMLIVCWITKATNAGWRVCSTSCFSAEEMVIRTRLIFCYTYIACLFACRTFLSSLTIMQDHQLSIEWRTLEAVTFLRILYWYGYFPSLNTYSHLGPTFRLGLLITSLFIRSHSIEYKSIKCINLQKYGQYHVRSEWVSIF